MAATKKSRTRSPRLTHLLPDGSAHMVDVTGKDHTAREVGNRNFGHVGPRARKRCKDERSQRRQQQQVD